MKLPMLIHYLDDFLGGAKTADDCIMALQSFKATMSELNVPLAEDKTFGPVKVKGKS
jgi:hypothetical protein